MDTYSISVMKQPACFGLALICGIINKALATNFAPIFTAPTSPIAVVENEKSQVSLYTISIFDPDGDPITCSLQSTNPNTFDFGVWKNASDYVLYLVAGSTLDFIVTSYYKLTLECSDGAAATTMNVTVNVTPNTPPTFGNLPATSGNANANTVQLGDVVYTVTASDVDSTSLTFSMTSYPASPALFEIDEVSGKVRATQDLKYAVNSAYDLTISVSDSRDTSTSHLIVPIANVNSAPVINNLPDTVYIRESIGGNTGLFTLSITDPDSGDSADITYVVNPSIYTSKFSLNGQELRLASGNRFDFEERNTFTVTFTVSDGKATTTSTNYVLNVNIVDVNENCDFEHNGYYVTLHEGEAGVETADPGFTITDEDVGSSYTLFLQNVQDAYYFHVDKYSGLISLKVNYDVDVRHPNSTSFRVLCMDNYGSIGTSTLYITIEDINDNSPIFDATGYIFYFDPTMAIPSTIGTLSASDADSGDNAAIDYTWSTTGSGSSYFNLLPSGVIIMQSDPRPFITFGDSFRFVVTATDNGSPSLTGTTTVDLIYDHQEVTTTTSNLTVNATTTTPLSTTTTTTSSPASSSNNKTFWAEPGNIATVVVAAVLGAVLCGLSAYLFKIYHDKHQPIKTKPKKIQPKPNPERTPFDFWGADESTTSSKKNSVVKAPTNPPTKMTWFL